MYQQLLQANLVIAGFSRHNVNVAFELGVRYGLRPHTAIIVAEEKLENLCDVDHIAIRRHKHPESIGKKRAKRFRSDHKQAIAEMLAKPKTDSPVYTFLHWPHPAPATRG